MFLNVSSTCKTWMQADVDGNGALDYGEFVAVIIHLQRLSNDEHLRRAFMFFDKDGSNFIELDELSEALADESGQTDINVLHDILREVDTDQVQVLLSAFFFFFHFCLKYCSS